MFGAQTVINAVKGGDEEGIKVLEAVRKRKERAKRKKRVARERQEDEEVSVFPYDVRLFLSELLGSDGRRTGIAFFEKGRRIR